MKLSISRLWCREVVRIVNAGLDIFWKSAGLKMLEPRLLVQSASAKGAATARDYDLKNCFENL